MDAQVWLICGFRRTGKDTLFQRLNGENTNSWRVYQHPSTRREDPFGLSDGKSFVRIAYADALKREAKEVYGIPNLDDLDKDVTQCIHYQTGTLVSPRDIYIEWGKIRREQDPEYWVKIAFAECQSEKIVVTDWRFQNEGKTTKGLFPNTITVRVYRSAVPEPALDIQSEHDLNDEQTDLLLVPDEVDFELAKCRYPQYGDYVFTGMI